jgi:hypothetical protein
VLLLPAARIAWQAPRGDPLAPQALPWLLAIVVLQAMLDAVLNSFVFFPAVLIAGALAKTQVPSVREDSRVRLNSSA